MRWHMGWVKVMGSPILEMRDRVLKHGLKKKRAALRQ